MSRTRRFARSGAAALAVVAVLAASDAAAGLVRGVLYMNGLARASTAPVAVRQRAQSGVDEAVVYVDQVPEKVERQLTERKRFWIFGKAADRKVLRIVQADQQFNPKVLAVTTGTPIEFRNMDRVYHSAFSVSSAKRFDLGKYAPGRKDTVVFNRTGMVNLHCDIHPDMVGYVVVTPNHVFTRPDTTGEFKLPKLPPGNYTVRAVHPAKGEIRRMVTMPKRGDIRLELMFR